MSDVFSGKGVEINLIEEDDFLVIKESLTRMGIGSFKNKTLYQSCHILHKQGRYAIVHFKEMFAFDGREVDISESDYKRRNRIAKILSDWNLCDLVNPIPDDTMAAPHEVKVLKHSDKENWKLEQKYDL